MYTRQINDIEKRQFYGQGKGIFTLPSNFAHYAYGKRKTLVEISRILATYIFYQEAEWKYDPLRFINMK
jgi:hypothetical protein